MKKSLASKEHSQEKQEFFKEPESPPNELEQIVKGFFRGTVCLHGGSGWWKYEVCYGKTVMQYHSENEKQRKNILLGVFDKAVHMVRMILIIAWAAEHPEKVIERKEDGRVMLVTHLYTQGDICEENGAHRFIKFYLSIGLSLFRSSEVLIRCRDDIDAHKVFIYMLEPSTCQYKVVLESTLFCEPLQNVDSLGLLSESVGALIPLSDEKQNEKGNKDGLD
uniref:Endoplasmic reticulum lectin 1 n=1 Tax=Meloidogyne hapla TaxID=6305 RepID=A0A1I8BP82_MELHA